MYLTHYFLPTLRDKPSDAILISHQLMLRAGIISQEAAGIYTWLPLGLRILKKIETIIREEQDKAGAVELLMPTLQPSELWQQSGRYNDYGPEMLRITDRHKRTLIYGPTNEEMVTALAARHLNSYRDVPLMVYHIQWKFRDEIRPRFGVMRGREFLMKDGYGLALTPEDAHTQYKAMLTSYLKIFDRMGLKAIPARAPTGAIGGTLSHEFHILAPTGESNIFYHKDHHGLIPDDDAEKHMECYASEEEFHKEHQDAPSKDITQARAIEAGHIFYFGDKYSRAMNFTLQTKDGAITHPLMGSYGIGISRLVGALIETNHDENGIIWHPSVAPFTMAIINLKQGDPSCDEQCFKLYHQLKARNIDVLYDDRHERAGVKFADMDLIGIPWQAIIGPKNAKTHQVEIKNRSTGTTELCTIDSIDDYIKHHAILSS